MTAGGKFGEIERPAFVRVSLNYSVVVPNDARAIEYARETLYEDIRDPHTDGEHWWRAIEVEPAYDAKPQDVPEFIHQYLDEEVEE